MVVSVVQEGKIDNIENNKKIITLTPKQASDKLRLLGMKMTPERIKKGIEQNVYPFGNCIEFNNKEYEIYETMLNKWIYERLS